MQTFSYQIPIEWHKT